MKAFRVYFIDGGERIYCCNQPGYWSHHCASPEYAIPFLSKEEAEDYAMFQEKCVAPRGQRFVEEYDEVRPMAIHKRSSNVILAEFLDYYHSGCSYISV